MVLALKTAEVTAHCGDGERGRTRKKVKDRFLLNGIDIGRNRPTIDKAKEPSFPVLPDSTNPSFRRRNDAAMVA